MLFEETIEKLRLSIGSPLPGEEAQYRMAPAKRAERAKKYDPATARQSAVLILLHPARGKAEFTVIRRTADKGPHSGQISLPGGAIEDVDDSHADAALRETWEEIGVPVSRIELIRELSPLYIPVSNFQVHPFVAFVDEQPVYTPDPEEVHSVHTVRLSDLVLPHLRKEKDFPTYIEGYKVRAPYFHLKELEIWGATSMILSEFAELVK